MNQEDGSKMQRYSRGKIGVITCLGGAPFGTRVVSHLEKILSDNGELEGPILKQSKEVWFSNGEMKTQILESLRNEDVYIIQDVANTAVVKNNRLLGVNDHYMALKTAVDAALRADAHYITVVIPYFPYSRQDRRKEREGITAKIVAQELESVGVNRVITLDIHNESIEGFFDPKKTKFENLRGSKCLVEYLLSQMNSGNVAVVAPDEGAVGRNTFYANLLKTPLRMFYKERDYTRANSIEKHILLGDVTGMHTIVVDDMIDTAGTMINVAQDLREAGALSVVIVNSLPVFSGPAIDRLSKAYEDKIISKVIGTDAIYHGEDFAKKHQWYDEVSVAEYEAASIYNINKGLSIKGMIRHERGE